MYYFLINLLIGTICVLVLAGIELIFFLVAIIGLSF